MYKVQWLSGYCIWHTSHSCNIEASAISAALRLAASGRYRGVRVVTREGAVVFVV